MAVDDGEAVAGLKGMAPGAGLEAEVTRVARGRLTARVRLVSLALSAVVVLIVVKVHLGEALAAAVAVPPALLLGVVAINIPVTALRAWRSHAIVAALGWRIPMLRMAGTQLVGQVMSWLTPAASGDLVRPYLWLRHDSVGIGSGVAAVVFERTISFLQLIAAGVALCAPLALPAPAAAAVTAGAVFLLVAPWVAGRIIRSDRFGGRAGDPAPDVRTRGSLWRVSRERLARLAGRTGRLSADGPLMLLMAGFGAAIFALCGWQIQLIAGAGGASIALWAAVGIYALSQAVGSLSSLPLGIGAADATLYGLLVAAGSSHPAALATAVLIRLSTTLPLGIAGAVAHLILGNVEPETPV